MHTDYNDFIAYSVGVFKIDIHNYNNNMMYRYVVSVVWDTINAILIN